MLTGRVLPRLYAFLQKTFRPVEEIALLKGESVGLEARAMATVAASLLAWAAWVLQVAYAVPEQEMA